MSMQHDESNSVTASMESWEGSAESRTASTVSLKQPYSMGTPIGSDTRAGPGLLLFPGTAQRHNQNLVPKCPKPKTTTVNANDEHVDPNRRKPCSVRSFRRPPLWQPPPTRQIKAEELRQEALAENELETGRFACLAKLQAFIIEFLQGSSIHGFIYLAKFGLNFVER